MHTRWRELIRGRSPSTQVEVAIDALLLTRELIAGELFVNTKGGCGGRINRKGRSSSKWEVATGGSTLCEFLRRRQALRALISQEDRRRCEFRKLQIKLGLRELHRLVAVSIESFFGSFFMRFGSFVVAAGGSRMRINLGLASLILQHATIYIPNYWIMFEFSYLNGFEIRTHLEKDWITFKQTLINHQLDA